MFTVKNQKYKVYQDPSARKKFEGIARVTIQFAEPIESGWVFCEVEFDDKPGRKFQRAIHPDDQVFD